MSVPDNEECIEMKVRGGRSKQSIDFMIDSLEAYLRDGIIVLLPESHELTRAQQYFRRGCEMLRKAVKQT